MKVSMISEVYPMSKFILIYKMGQSTVHERLLLVINTNDISVWKYLWKHK